MSCKKKSDSTITDIDTDSVSEILPNLVKVKNKLFSVPSPLQLSDYIQKENIVFDIELLNSPDNYSRYLTTTKQALNIGVYGADLGNLFVNDQLSESAKYFSVVKMLAEQVGVMNSIDEKLLDRIDKNNQNKDSLIYLMSDVYKEIDNYLTGNDQQDIGILIIVGGWVESLYYLCKIAENYNNPDLYDKIAEQKNPLNNILALMQPFYNQKDSDYDKLLENLTNLSIIFDSIEEIYTYKAPENIPQEKLTIIHSTTTYNITEEQVKDINKQITDIRNWIIE